MKGIKDKKYKIFSMSDNFNIGDIVELKARPTIRRVVLYDGLGNLRLFCNTPSKIASRPLQDRDDFSNYRKTGVNIIEFLYHNQ